MTSSKNERDGGSPFAPSSNMKKGAIYLLATAIVFGALIWFIPDVVGFDLAGFMRSKNVAAFLRIALGVFFLVLLGLSIRYAIASFTLAGESWREGLNNALRSHIFGRDGVSILLLLFIGIALIAWGLIDLLA